VAKKRAATKSQTKTGPESAQIKAIERLLEEGKYREAIRKIRPALGRFPDHGGLHRALVEALEHGKGPRAAGLAAFAWAVRRPNSLPAQQALLRVASRLGHLLLADQTAQKVRALGGQTPGFPLDPAVTDSVLGELGVPQTGVDAMVRFDIGRLHLEGGDFAGTLRWLDDIDISPARNNRALALFHLDRVDEALAAFLANWEREPKNLFALAWAARLRLYQGDANGAQGLCTPLAASTASRLDDALPQIEVLLLLGHDQAAWDAFARTRTQAWFETRAHAAGAMLRHLGACAACRLGNVEDARHWWQAALSVEPDFTLASPNLSPSSEAATLARLPTIFESHHVLPSTWTTALFADKADGAGQLDALTASNAYLEALYRGGDATLRSLISIVLKHRAEQADEAAAGLLRAFARLPIGEKDERFGFLSFLRKQRLIGPGEAIEFWDGERLREVTVTDTEIYRQPKQSDLPLDLEVLLSEAVTLFTEGQADDAEVRLKAILERVPDHPVALGNLAAVRSLQGRVDESRRLLRDVVAKHPDYLFGRCNLAQILIEDGDLDEAQTLLDGLIERDSLHIQEAFMVWGTLAMLYAARGEEAAAQSLLANLETMVEDDDDARRLARIKQSIDWLDPAQRFTQTMRALLTRRPNRS